MVFRDLGGCWVVMLDCRAYMASVEAIWVVLWGLGDCWVVMLDCRAFMASV